MPWLPLAVPVRVLKDASSVPLCIFQWQMISHLSILLVVNEDRPLHTSWAQMRQETHEVRFHPSRCWSTFFWWNFFLLQALLRCPNVAHSLSRCLSETVSCERWTEQTVRSVRKYQWKNILLGYRFFNLLVRSSARLKTIISNGP